MAWNAIENFNEYVAGVDLNGGNGGSGWGGAWSTSGANEVLSAIAPAGMTGLALKSTWVSGDAGSGSRALAATIDPTTSGVFYMSWLMMAEQGNKNGRFGPGEIGVASRINIRFNSSGQIVASAAADTVLQTYSANQVYRISLKIGHVSGKFAVSIDGGAYSSDLQISGTTPYPITGVALANEETTAGVFWIDDITGDGAPAPTLSVKALVVAGGGAGGKSATNAGAGLGGGAGGVLYSASHLINPGQYYVTVGSGATTSSGSGTIQGQSGSNSVFDTLTAFGGGGGGSDGGAPGLNGGSGGGGGFGQAAGAGVSGQGYGGGSGGGPGGGGGAGAVGGSAALITDQPGAGGVGVSNSISGAAVYYGGGGGAGKYLYGTPGDGGNGGGGAGANGTNNATAGTANTGGGGGGGGYDLSTPGTGGAGGSGIVIIRYLTGSLAALGGTITTDGADTIHTFTTSGTLTVGTALGKALVVAGGGGGGTANAGSGTSGGGGAGGYLYEASYPISSGSYAVTVGGTSTAGTSGNNSIFSTLTALGGGAGGNYAGNGINGGSGGGAGGDGATGGTGSQGYAGGNGGGSYASSAGGGGAGAVGGTAGSGNVGAVGGDGLSNSITGSAVYYAGGGGGAGNTNAGGAGGGGAGSNAGQGTNGTANLGGGGGGSTGGNFNTSGGSGVVIISYPTASFTHTGGNSTGTDGANTWVRFTADGTLVLTGQSTIHFSPFPSHYNV